MSNYLWTANGQYIKKDLLEHLSESTTNLNIKDDSICIDDTCISKNEISELKKLIPSYNILERSTYLDSLTQNECKMYFKDVFMKILQSSGDIEKMKVFNEYFAYGLYDPKSADKLSFNNFYLDKVNNFVDFQDIYFGIDSFNVVSTTLPEDLIKYVMETNNSKVDDRLVLCLSLNDVNNVSSNSYFIQYKNYTIQIFKLTTISDSRWRILLITNNMLNSMYIKQDEIFNEKFKNELDTLDIYNNKNELSLTEFRSYIYNLRGVSKLDGLFNFEVFKNNLFTNYYKETLDLKDLTDEIVTQKVDNPENFDKLEFENVQDEKIYLGYFELHNTYILLEDSDTLNIKLIYGKKNSTDIFKWMIVFIKK